MDRLTLSKRWQAFLGARLREKLFAGRPAIGEEIRIAGVRFTVVGTMDRKMQLSNYFTSDDECVFIPYSSAGDLWDNRYASVLVFSAITPSLEPAAMDQVRAAIEEAALLADRKRAIQMFAGRVPADHHGITIACRSCSSHIAAHPGSAGRIHELMLVCGRRIARSACARARGQEAPIRARFLVEALVLTLFGGAADRPGLRSTAAVCRCPCSRALQGHSGRAT